MALVIFFFAVYVVMELLVLLWQQWSHKYDNVFKDYIKHIDAYIYEYIYISQIDKNNAYLKFSCPPEQALGTANDERDVTLVFQVIVEKID